MLLPSSCIVKVLSWHDLGYVGLLLKCISCQHTCMQEPWHCLPFQADLLNHLKFPTQPHARVRRSTSVHPSVYVHAGPRWSTGSMLVLDLFLPAGPEVSKRPQHQEAWPYLAATGNNRKSCLSEQGNWYKQTAPGTGQLNQLTEGHACWRSKVWFPPRTVQERSGAGKTTLERAHCSCNVPLIRPRA